MENIIKMLRRNKNLSVHKLGSIYIADSTINPFVTIIVFQDHFSVINYVTGIVVKNYGAKDKIIVEYTYIGGGIR
jgi:hypothetical protein